VSRTLEMTYEEVEAACQAGQEVYVVWDESGAAPLKFVPSENHKRYFYDNTGHWAFYKKENYWHAWADFQKSKQQP
jgi:hypothetical protein